MYLCSWMSSNLLLLSVYFKQEQVCSVDDISDCDALAPALCTLCFTHFRRLPLLHNHPPAPIAQFVECPLRGTGGHGFDPGPRLTKVVKNDTSCSSLGTQTYGVELGLVDPVSG